MKKYIKIIILGFISWAIPFIISIPFYSKEGQVIIDIFLFKSIMIIIGTLTGAILLIYYFKGIKKHIYDGIFVGIIWYIINVILDLVILVPLSDISIKNYFFQIGIRYLLIPIMSIAMGYVASMNFKNIK